MAGPAMLRLIHVDLFSTAEPVYHVASKGRCRDRIAAFVGSYKEGSGPGKLSQPPFLFIVNIALPGNPIVSTVMYWALDVGEAEAEAEAAGEKGNKSLGMLKRYLVPPHPGGQIQEPQSPASNTSPGGIWCPPPPCPAPFACSNSRHGSPPRNPCAENRVAKMLLNQNVFHPVGPVDGDGADDNIQSVLASGHSGVAEGGAQASEGVGAGVGAGDGSWAGQGAGEGAGEVVEAGVAAAIHESGEKGLLPVEDFRNQRFKLIPSIVEGPFMVRRAVGNKPALLGRKLRQRYFRGDHYVETDVDVGSSMVAARIVGLCRGYAQSLVVELGICLEGRCEEELPEQCIGVIRLVRLDLTGAEPLEPADEPL
ncbi:unnamed protein product [Discosporangium mesarthrocarpum]